MASAQVKTRMLKDGRHRYTVVYRLGGRGSRQISGGTFPTLMQAEKAAERIMELIALGINPTDQRAVEQVYFVQAASGEGPIKIGLSDNPERRLADLQVGSPVGLQLLATMEGGLEREQILHRTFAESRLHGEWFEPTPELLEVIRKAKRLNRRTERLAEVAA